MTEVDAPHSFVAYQRNALSRGRLPLSNHQVLSTCDIDEMHSEVGRVLCGHNAKSLASKRPAADATLHHAPLSATAAIYLNYGVETKVRVEELGFYLLEVQLSGSCETEYGRDRVNTKPGCIVMAGPNRSFSSHWDTRCSKLLIRIDSLALEKQLGVIMGHSPDRALEFELEHPIGTGPAASLWRNLRLLIGELEDPASLLNTVPGAGREAEQHLLWTLLHVLPSNYSAELSIESPQPSKGYLERVEEYIDEHCAHSLTLADLAEVAGVSGRTLLEGFRRHRGISPMRMLKTARLDRARGELLRADPDSDSVTRVALRWGFQHLGRFSIEYKRRFGESPSSTLQRRSGANQRASS
ncbi:MAG: AraC family transcriptional regulator [Gammaproteobacteria bacterium]